MQRSLPTYFMRREGGKKPSSDMKKSRNSSAFIHIKYRYLCSDIKRENQNCRKIGSVARKIRKSILSNFLSVESTSKIFDLRYEKLNFSSQEHHRGVNSFDNENFLFYTLGLKLPLSMRKITLLLKNGKKSSFFDVLKTRSNIFFLFLRVPKKIFLAKKFIGV